MTKSEALSVLKNAAFLGTEEDAAKVTEAIDTIERAVDAVPVVLCKDCKYVSTVRTPESARKFGQLYDCGVGVFGSPSADDFCSYGERREEDGTAD